MDYKKHLYFTDIKVFLKCQFKLMKIMMLTCLQSLLLYPNQENMSEFKQEEARTLSSRVGRRPGLPKGRRSGQDYQCFCATSLSSLHTGSDCFFTIFFHTHKCPISIVSDLQHRCRVGPLI